jgi:four helix bundle protein
MIDKQVIRSATSIEANVFEVKKTRKQGDFIHKMNIAVREASEIL